MLTGEIPIDEIEPNPEQTRKKIDKEGIENLAESIKNYGLLLPVSVVEKEGKYQLITGERRWRAYKKLGKEKIPAILKSKDKADFLLENLIENLHREDLNPIATAKRIKEGNNRKEEKL